VVADGSGTVLLDEPLVDAPRTEVVRWSPVPDLLPVLAQLPVRVPHVIAIVDRVGADLELIGESGGPVGQSVDGETAYLHKVQVGGWSQLRYQHSSEEVWARNARQVADVLDRRARGMAARFVLVAGDERARQLLVERLSPAVRPLVVETDRGGRAAGADRDAVLARAAELVGEQQARDDAAALEQLAAGLHRGAAVVGTDAVVDALRQGRVALLLAADVGVGGELLTGPGPLELWTRAEELAAMGVRRGERVSAEAALVRAAVAEDADVVVVPAAALPHRSPVAAVLRFADPPAP
jgi:Bacterial archaeo-eukaryotic release factor family 2